MQPIVINILSEVIQGQALYSSLKKENFILEIFFEPDKSVKPVSTVITDLHTNCFSAFVKQFTMVNKNPQIVKGNVKLIFSSDVTNFEISLLGLVALMKKRFSTIDFEITIPDRKDTKSYFRFISTLLTIRNSYQILTSVRLFDINGEHLLAGQRLTASEGIIPITLINENNFQAMFIGPNRIFDIDGLFSGIEKKEVEKELQLQLGVHANTSVKNPELGNYRAIREVIKTFEYKISWQNTNRMFIQHYFRMISGFDLLSAQLESYSGYRPVVNFQKVSRGGLMEDKLIKVKKAFENLLARLKEQPPFFILIFSILSNRNMGKKINDADKYIAKLRELFDFSRNLFLGIKELARNIIEHTSSGTGVLIGKIYRGDDHLYLRGIEKRMFASHMIGAYHQQVEKSGAIKGSAEKKDFLDMTIFDEGTFGIINKTIENTRTLCGLNSPHTNLYTKDLQALESGEIVFSDFYNPANIKLNHHAIKSASHWGLIVFTNLIQKNNGLFFVSSVAQGTESFDSHYRIPGQASSKIRIANYFEAGTVYNIILPLDGEFTLKDDNLINTIPLESNFSETSFFQLGKFSYIENDSMLKGNGRYMLYKLAVKPFLPEDNQIGYRYENIIAKKAAEKLMKTVAKRPHIIPVIDFGDCGNFFDQSNLMRFIGELQNEVDINALILLNVDKQIVNDLFDTLGAAAKGGDEKSLNRPFWNDEHFILIYSYESNQDGSRIYVSNILGGKDYNDFFLLNYNISHSHFTDKLFRYPVSRRLSRQTALGVKTCPFYVPGTNYLQNFEMIITHGQKTLFEHIVEYLLSEEVTF